MVTLIMKDPGLPFYRDSPRVLRPNSRVIPDTVDLVLGKLPVSQMESGLKFLNARKVIDVNLDINIILHFLGFKMTLFVMN